jgi:23S rRNA (guanosine2251-2'-O)-methyltransferase
MRRAKIEPHAAKETRIRLSDDLLWGVHPVYESLTKEPQYLAEIIVQKERHGSKLADILLLARKHDIKLVFVDALRLTGEGSAEVRHQGIVARRSSAPIVDFNILLNQLSERIKEGEKPRVMVCDCLQDPHNLGAIIRSAFASGASAVIMTRERSAPLGGTAAKASAGAISHIPICQVTNLVATLKALKDAGFWVFGAVKDRHAHSVYATDLTVPSCLVIGSEGKGVRPLVQKECDMLIYIPMADELDSLNSSVAAAVILFESLRQSLAAGPPSN